MGLGEIILIVVVALLFIGPEKLPEAAKSLSKGIRDIRKQTRELKETIEDDTEFGGAIRDLQSALRGDDLHAAARRKVVMQKSATVKPEIAPAPTADTAISAAAATSAPAAAAPRIEPVIAASAGAIARGGSVPAASAGAAAPSAEAASAASVAQSEAAGPAGAAQGEAAPTTEPAPGRAHG